MPLWIAWFDAIRALRPACRRLSAFLWMILALIGLSCCPERAGVTSLVCLFGFGNKGYRRFLHLFHSRALDLEALTACWARLCLRHFEPVAVGERLFCLADGIKAPKEGRKMPAVKLLDQQSASNSKPEYIMGHSFHAVSVLVQEPAGQVAAVPPGLAHSRGAGLVQPLDAHPARQAGAAAVLALRHPQSQTDPGRRCLLRLEQDDRALTRPGASTRHAYHFWMAAMKPRRRGQGDQYLHRATQTYSDAVRRKMNAFHLHVQLGCVAQGLLQHLALSHTAEVWQQFQSWLRTMNPALPPSELVVACALRATLPEFLQAALLPHQLRIILRRYCEPRNASQSNDCSLETAA